MVAEKIEQANDALVDRIIRLALAADAPRAFRRRCLFDEGRTSSAIFCRPRRCRLLNRVKDYVADGVDIDYPATASWRWRI